MGEASGGRGGLGCHGRRIFFMDFRPYGYETSIFTLYASHEKVQGWQTKLHLGFNPGQTSAAFPRYLKSQRFPHCSVQTVLMMSSRFSHRAVDIDYFLFFAFFCKN